MGRSDVLDPRLTGSRRLCYDSVPTADRRARRAADAADAEERRKRPVGTQAVPKPVETGTTSGRIAIPKSSAVHHGSRRDAYAPKRVLQCSGETLTGSFYRLRRDYGA